MIIRIFSPYEDINLSVENCKYVTLKYKSSFKKNSVHNNFAGKLYTLSNEIISVYYLREPIIIIDNDGDASIWVTNNPKEHKTFEQIISYGKEIKIKKSLYEAKASFGLSLHDYINNKHCEVDYELFKLSKVKLNNRKWGDL